MSYEVIFKRNTDVILILHHLINRTSTMEAIKVQQDTGLTFDTADIFETHGKLRYFMSRKKFHKT